MSKLFIFTELDIWNSRILNAQCPNNKVYRRFAPIYFIVYILGFRVAGKYTDGRVFDNGFYYTVHVKLRMNYVRLTSYGY